MFAQSDLVDQLFNNSERRLAMILLLMAEFGKGAELETLIPAITQEAWADMIGTTRSRVGFSMNRFRKLGFIEYSGRTRVTSPCSMSFFMTRTGRGFLQGRLKAFHLACPAIF